MSSNAAHFVAFGGSTTGIGSCVLLGLVPSASCTRSTAASISLHLIGATPRIVARARPAPVLLDRPPVSAPIAMFIFIVFLNRYVFGLYFRLIRGRKIDDRDPTYEPTVTIVVPLFNEGPSIYDTIKSL